MKKILSLICIFLILTACSTVKYTRSPKIDARGAWAVVDFNNHTVTPMAGARAASISDSLVRARGVNNLIYKSFNQQDKALPLMNTGVSRSEIIQWASRNNIRYVLTGDVNEWRYKVGIDGEPVVGVSLRIIDVPNHHVIWSSVGSQSGHVRQAVSMIGQQLIARLLTHARIA